MNAIRDNTFVYVLQSEKDGKWYTGCTYDLRKRLKEHQTGKVQSTKGRGPLTPLYYEARRNGDDSFSRERYLKNGMGKRYLRNRNKRFLSLTV